MRIGESRLTDRDHIGEVRPPVFAHDRVRDAGDVGGWRPKRKDVFTMGAENAVEASRPSAFEVLAELKMGVKFLIDFFKRVFFGKGRMSASSWKGQLVVSSL